MRSFAGISSGLLYAALQTTKPDLEPTMTQQPQTASKVWNKPELARLGKLADVAGTQNTNRQTGNSKS